MEDTKDDSGFPANGTADEVNAYLSNVIKATQLLKPSEQTPAPLTASLARTGERLDRLLTSALRALKLEGFLHRLSVFPDPGQELNPTPCQSTRVPQKAPSGKA